LQGHVKAFKNAKQTVARELGVECELVVGVRSSALRTALHTHTHTHGGHALHCTASHYTALHRNTPLYASPDTHSGCAPRRPQRTLDTHCTTRVVLSCVNQTNCARQATRHTRLLVVVFVPVLCTAAVDTIWSHTPPMHNSSHDAHASRLLHGGPTRAKCRVCVRLRRYTATRRLSRTRDCPC
jgi:hypothetical protein